MIFMKDKVGGGEREKESEQEREIERARENMSMFHLSVRFPYGHNQPRLGKAEARNPIQISQMTSRDLST